MPQCFEMVSTFIRRWEIQTHTGLSLRNVVYTRHDVTWFVERMAFGTHDSCAWSSRNWSLQILKRIFIIVSQYWHLVTESVCEGLPRTESASRDGKWRPCGSAYLPVSYWSALVTVTSRKNLLCQLSFKSFSYIMTPAGTSIVFLIFNI
jgi:hypothetical protein